MKKTQFYKFLSEISILLGFDKVAVIVAKVFKIIAEVLKYIFAILIVIGLIVLAVVTFPWGLLFFFLWLIVIK